MRIHRIRVPTPFKVGPVNVYLIQEDPLTLVDVGPLTGEAMTALKHGLADLGHQLRDIKRIVITHGHPDHFGLARKVVEASGCKVHIHEWEAPVVAGGAGYAPFKRLLAAAGAPEDALFKLERRFAGYRKYAEGLDEVEKLSDGDTIAFDPGSFIVVHTPGHTPGSICLLREADRMMVSGDTILKHITPNPVLNPDPVDERRRFQSLSEYLVSLARIKSISPTLLKGGHGDDIADYPEYFNRLYRFTRKRQSKLISLIPRSGASAWEASLLLFPDVEDDNRFLALSETIAHLDFAVSEGKLASDQNGGVESYYR